MQFVHFSPNLHLQVKCSGRQDANGDDETAGATFQSNSSIHSSKALTGSPAAA
jgi:hypothetical protein